jgi:hypothetical protein
MKGETAAYFFLLLGAGMMVVGAAVWIAIEGWATWDAWRRMKIASGALVFLGLINSMLSPLALLTH